MEAARKRRLLWTASGVLAILVGAVVFSAYLKPDMVAAFGDIMSFCAALIR
jgi:hypothetical protein